MGKLNRESARVEIIPQGVKLIEESISGNEETLVYLTAAQSRAGGMVYDEELPSIKKQRAVIKRVLGYGHESVCEVRGVMFNITANRATVQQLLRHRFINVCQQSQRYVGFNDTYTFIAPQDILENEEELEKYQERLHCAVLNYIDYYNELIEKYSKERSPETMAQEQARDLIPQAVASSLVINANFRQLRHIFRLRTCKRAQSPIRELALEMLKHVRREFPSIFDGVGPSCVENGYCKDADRCFGVPSLDDLRGHNIR